VQRHAIPRWGKLQATTITRGDVKQMMARISAPIVANQTLAAVSAVFSWAVKEEIVAANPCRGVDRNATRSRERVLADSELPRFWAAFDDAGLIAGSALRIILLSGQRPGEVAHMRREHIRDGWWEMPGEPQPSTGWPGTKNGASHRVWLSAPVQKLLAELSDDDVASGFVFAGARCGRAARGLDADMRAICKTLSAERATPHDLRRTFLTKVTALGFGRDAMDRIANHVEGKVTDTYDRHGYADENKRVMETVAARLISLAEGRTDEKVVPLRR
jgi:integrase